MAHSYLIDRCFFVGGKKIKIKISNIDTIPPKATFGEHILDRNTLDATKKVNVRFKNIVYNSDDLGETWKLKKIDNISEIKNIFTTISDKIIISGSDSENPDRHRITVLDRNLNQLNSSISGKFSWHGTYSIDESDGCIMYGEYPPNKSSDINKFSSTVMRSLDDGFSWEEILKIGHPTIRHFHTCNSIPFIENGWLVTSGNAPKQCKFLLSKDNGDTWGEINDIKQISKLNNDFKNAIHRTVVMQFHDNELIWATDDIIGPIEMYQEENGKYSVGSKLITSKITEGSMNIEIICRFGMHVRSMIDIGEGWIFITEAKYLDKVKGPQVFLILKDKIDKPYLLFEIENSTSRITGGTYSRSSIKSYDGVFFTQMGDGMFNQKSARTLKWEVKLETDYDENNNNEKEVNIRYLNLKRSYSKSEFWKGRYFKPRKDLEKWKIPKIIDYDCDPFGDTNWMFQLNALRTLDPLMENGVEKIHLEYIIESILQWDKFDKSKLNQGDYRWHDMATGIRGEKIGYMLSLLKNNFPERIGDISKLEKIALEHYEKLMEERFLSKGNHGVFQIHGLMAISIGLGGSEYKKGKEYCEYNMEWFLKDQFFSDGFHSENSPEYHIYMISVFEKIIDSGWYSSGGISQLWENILEKACFLLWPDGNIIEIGDSNPSKVSKKYKEGFINKLSAEINDNKKYLNNGRLMIQSKESGYTIVRSPFVSNSDNYMLMTVSAFKKRQHRHSDDLGFTLYENNEKIFVFPGKYSYGKSREREYVLKTRAHNCLEIDDTDFPRTGGHEYNTAIVDIQNNEDEIIIQKMKKWDHLDTIQNRKIIYSPGEFILILDIFETGIKRNFKQWFHFGECFNESFTIDDNIITSESENNTIKGIMVSSQIKEQKIKHYYQSKDTLSGHTSGSYNKLVPINTICNEISSDNGYLGAIFGFKTDDLKISVKLEDLSVKVKITIGQISKSFDLEIY